MNAQEATAIIRIKAIEHNGSFDIDEENAGAVDRIAHWLAREKCDGLDRNKGLLVLGNVGSGKTMLMRALRSAMSDIWGVSFGLKPCAELVRDFTDCGYEGLEKWIEGKHICFDDLGTEGEGIHYGKRSNVMSEVIEARYDRMVSGRGKCWTHFTTNLGASDLRKHLGERAYSRLLHMCNVIELGTSAESKDRRREAPAPMPLVPVNADNIYTKIHPSIAAKLNEAIAPVVRKIQEEREEVASVPMQSTSQEQDRKTFALGIQDVDIEQLRASRERYLKNYPEGLPGYDEAQRYVQIIDAEIEQRGKVITMNKAS